MQKKDYIQQYINNGYALFPMTGKKGLPKGWNLVEHDMFLDPKDLPNNIGVRLGDDDLIIDVDPRNFAEGDKPHVRLSDDIKWKFNTTMVKTGDGGLHIYLKKPPELKFRKKHKSYQGIDFLTKGCFVLGAGSTHPETKKIYKIVRGEIGTATSAPATLLELLQISDQEFSDLNSCGEFVDDAQTVERYAHWIGRSEPAISGQGGDHHTFTVACQGRRFGLSAEKNLEVMLGEWNDRCEPPWDEDELRIKLFNAYTYNVEPVGTHSPHADFEPIPKEDKEEDKEEDKKEDKKEEKVESVTKIIWQRNEKGNLLTNSIHNVSNYFTCNPNAKELKGLLRFNLFTKNIEFDRRPIWLDSNEPITPWDDTDAILCRKILSSNYAFNIQKNLIHEAALAAAVVSSYHPVKDYLNTLKWDGVSRVDNWMTTYLGAKDTDYEKAVGKLLLVAAVTRIFHAGCKYESLVVLEGDQGVGKTRACAILGGEWYGDIVLDAHNKDTVDAMRLKWIIEVSEMEMARRTDVNAMKTFLSRQVDTVRLAYARGAKDFPRHQIFIGTINPESGGYLKDMTGNRRFFPIAVEQIDQEKLIADRDQLWAEAVQIYKEMGNAESELYIKDKRICEMAASEADKRRARDPWMVRVEEWLNNSEVSKDFVKGEDIYKFAIGGEDKDFDRTKQTRIANVMFDLGWGKTSPHRVNGKVVRGFIRPEHLKPNVENL